MNTFIWTDDMVKDVCRDVYVFVDLGGCTDDRRYDINQIIEDYKKFYIMNQEGTFENKVYWRVNLDNLCIAPVSEIPPIEDGDLYFTTYPEAGNYVTKILTKNLFNNASK